MAGLRRRQTPGTPTITPGQGWSRCAGYLTETPTLKPAWALGYIVPFFCPYRSAHVCSRAYRADTGGGWSG